MRALGTLLVIVGVGVAAASGARNTDELVERQRMEGAAALAEEGTPAEEVEPPPPQEPTARLEGWLEANGLPFFGGLALVLVGSLLFRRAQQQAVAKPDGAGSERHGPADLGDALEALSAELVALQREVAAGLPDPDAVQARIEALQLDQVEPIVEARHQMQLRYGVAGMAAVMGPFSSGERNLNRAWSTLVDGHQPETAAALDKAAAGVAAAREALAGLTT